MSVRRPPDGRSVASIVDLVFAGEPRTRRRRLWLSGLAVLAVYAGALALVSHVGRAPPPAIATHVEDPIDIERDIDPPRAAPSTPTRDSRPVRALRVARASHAPRTAPSAPAQAAQLAAVAPSPADFTGLAFVVGTSATYAGGTTTSRGTSRAPVSGSVASGVRPAPGRSRSVSLDGAAWSCPWPAEADAQQVNEQTVVLRVNVNADGRAQHVDVLSDPGYGFASAARVCAATTRFEPARDVAGQAIAALSPPIRVHFSR